MFYSTLVFYSYTKQTISDQLLLIYAISMDTILRKCGEFDANERHLIASFSVPWLRHWQPCSAPAVRLSCMLLIIYMRRWSRLPMATLPDERRGASHGFCALIFPRLKRGFGVAIFTQTREGGVMKSVSITLRNRAGQPIGMLCVNFSLDTTLGSLVQTMTPTPLVSPKMRISRARSKTWS